MKSVAFIDCFMDTPVIHSINSYSQHTKINCTYHMPSKFGLKSLEMLEQADGYIILGSASHVTENLPWHKDLLDFIIPKIESNIPTLGICFGHQLIADYYGCEIDYLSENKTINIHSREITFSKDEMGCKKSSSLKLAFAHSQVVKALSNNFYSFASSNTSENEAIKHNKYNFWGVQAHPEASQLFLETETQLSDLKTIDQIIKNGFSFIDNFVALL